MNTKEINVGTVLEFVSQSQMAERKRLQEFLKTWVEDRELLTMLKLMQQPITFQYYRSGEAVTLTEKDLSQVVQEANRRKLVF